MTKSEKKISFEEALEELEKIAEKLERQSLSLEDSIKAFERGTELKKICADRLKEAEGKIEFLQKNSDGSTTRESFIKEKSHSKLDDSDGIF
jgi:exodeoxyribonuclease VII small subunit